ncbi:uncharacterized protein LOC142240151 [Haematobia irritans]|uniref:uncharacterized protein LOC142240151 n=1 Tax=Haematobia irritans TaxID=7368 RepID=UPI003F4F6E58
MLPICFTINGFNFKPAQNLNHKTYYNNYSLSLAANSTNELLIINQSSCTLTIKASYAILLTITASNSEMIFKIKIEYHFSLYSNGPANVTPPAFVITSLPSLTRGGSMTFESNSGLAKISPLQVSLKLFCKYPTGNGSTSGPVQEHHLDSPKGHVLEQLSTITPYITAHETVWDKLLGPCFHPYRTNFPLGSHLFLTFSISLQKVLLLEEISLYQSFTNNSLKRTQHPTIAMKYNTNFDYQAKIEENLEKLHTLRLHSHPIKSAQKTKVKPQSHHNKWNAIVKRLGLQPINNKIQSPREISVQGKLPVKDEVLDILTRSLMLEHTMIHLTKILGNFRRIPLLCIFIGNAVTIVFNTYNLVVCLLDMDLAGPAKTTLSVGMLCLFYGFYIIASFLTTVIIVVVYQCVYEEIRKAGCIVDEWNIYVWDKDIKQMLSQFSAFVFNNLREFTVYGLYEMNGALIKSLISGTATYVVILIQYNGDGDILTNHPNNTNHG